VQLEVVLLEHRRESSLLWIPDVCMRGARGLQLQRAKTYDGANFGLLLLKNLLRNQL
jgi:hypothetical protein